MNIKTLRRIALSLSVGAMILIAGFGCRQGKTRVLVFTKTAGFKHSSIPAGSQALQELGKEYGFQVDVTNDASKFNADTLRLYKAIVFLNTTGDVLNDDQQADFEEYIQAGGGFAGVHAAADTEYDWPWYGKMVGGYFMSHPHIQEATVKVMDKDHISTRHLPEKWNRKDEWYNYKSLNPHVHVLATLDEHTYEGGKNGDFHPIAWYHEYDGGRAFYTGGGHTDECYSEPDFIKHLALGILWAAGE